jgi:nicotinamidase-related amidase
VQQAMIVGNPVLVVVDIQNSIGMSREDLGIPTMGGEAERFERAIEIVDGARAAGIPIVFFREVHRRTRVDFGRELDGQETIHCLDDDPATSFAPRLCPRPDEYEIAKRRYSCFFGTDLEILLKGLNADTLILIGGLTDVCVHYTFVDGHQHDYYVRVVEDCVGGSSYPAHDAALAAMEYLQTGARRKTAEILDAFAAMARPRSAATHAVSATT